MQAMTIFEFTASVNKAHDLFKSQTNPDVAMYDSLADCFAEELNYYFSFCYVRTATIPEAIALYWLMLPYKDKAFTPYRLWNILDEYCLGKISRIQLIHLLELECCPKTENLRNLRRAEKKGALALYPNLEKRKR